MELDGLHLLITYQCTFECDHCFAWGSPWQSGTMTIETVRSILNQAKEAGFVEWIYFEGGEPFLYYQTMLAGVNEAFELGFKIGIVTNSYWATSEEDALLWLSPLEGKIQDLTISSDLFHYSEKISQQSKYVSQVAGQLNLPLGVICIEQPENQGISTIGQIPPESASIMYRGRAVEKLVAKTTLYPANLFTNCPHENLIDPGRVHIDPFGNLHICQGISLGNIFNSSLKEICDDFDPFNHPIIGPLLDGGPIQLAKRYDVPVSENYADACHLCYETRKVLRNQFPDILMPDQMYGVVS
ncbi:MAG: radical SAM protein [Anaerolineales bacterium]